MSWLIFLLRSKQQLLLRRAPSWQQTARMQQKPVPQQHCKARIWHKDMLTRRVTAQMLPGNRQKMLRTAKKLQRRPRQMPKQVQRAQPAVPAPLRKVRVQRRTVPVRRAQAQRRQRIIVTLRWKAPRGLLIVHRQPLTVRKVPLPAPRRQDSLHLLRYRVHRMQQAAQRLRQEVPLQQASKQSQQIPARRKHRPAQRLPKAGRLAEQEHEMAKIKTTQSIMLSWHRQWRRAHRDTLQQPMR